jgi:hypothetical protein
MRKSRLIIGVVIVAGALPLMTTDYSVGATWIPGGLR